MGAIMRGCAIARRLGVSRLLLGAALVAFGSLLLGAFGMATTAWASDETAEATGLAVVTDPLSAEVSEMSRLAARLVPQNQQGHRTPADGGTAPWLVSGLVEPVGSLVNEQVSYVDAALRANARSGPSDGESVGVGAAEVVTPLLGTLVQGAASVTEDPAAAVSGVYKTVAPSAVPADLVARLVTDGLAPSSDAVPPGGALADGGGQPSFTTLQPDTDSTEVAAALNRASLDRSAATFECSAAHGEQEADSDSDHDRKRAPDADAAQPWTGDGPGLPSLKYIPGGVICSTAGISVDGGKAAVDVSPPAAGEQVSFARSAIGELGRPMDRAAELSAAPD